MGSGCSCTSYSSALDSRTADNRTAHVPLPPVPENEAQEYPEQDALQEQDGPQGLPDSARLPVFTRDRSKLSIPETPVGKEKDVFKFYCPICFYWFKEMYRTDCCQHYICEMCALDHIQNKLPDAVPEHLTPVEYAIDCPHCNLHKTTFREVSSVDDIRRYQESPHTKRALEMCRSGLAKSQRADQHRVSPIKMGKLTPKRPASTPLVPAGASVPPSARSSSSNGLPPAHPQANVTLQDPRTRGGDEASQTAFSFSQRDRRMSIEREKQRELAGLAVSTAAGGQRSSVTASPARSLQFGDMSDMDTAPSTALPPDMIEQTIEMKHAADNNTRGDTAGQPEECKEHSTQERAETALLEANYMPQLDTSHADSEDVDLAHPNEIVSVS